MASDQVKALIDRCAGRWKRSIWEEKELLGNRHLTLPSPPNKKNLRTERPVFRAAVGTWMRTGGPRPFQPHLLWTRQQPVGGQAGFWPGLHDSFGLLRSAAFQGPWPLCQPGAPSCFEIFLRCAWTRSQHGSAALEIEFFTLVFSFFPLFSM